MNWCLLRITHSLAKVRASFVQKKKTSIMNGVGLIITLCCIFGLDRGKRLFAFPSSSSYDAAQRK
jgi:hypothetical protein